MVYKDNHSKEVPMAATNYVVSIFFCGIRLYHRDFTEDITSLAPIHTRKQGMGFSSNNKS